MKTIADDSRRGIIRAGVGDRSPATADPSIAHFNTPLLEKILTGVDPLSPQTAFFADLGLTGGGMSCRDLLEDVI